MQIENPHRPRLDFPDSILQLLSESFVTRTLTGGRSNLAILKRTEDILAFSRGNYAGFFLWNLNSNY